MLSIYPIYGVFSLAKFIKGINNALNQNSFAGYIFQVFGFHLEKSLLKYVDGMKSSVYICLEDLSFRTIKKREKQGGHELYG